MIKAVVYALAERADTILLFLLYHFLLCGSVHRPYLQYLRTTGTVHTVFTVLQVLQGKRQKFVEFK
jgi:hypothetical protein